MVSSIILSVLLLLFKQASGTDVVVLPLGVTREFVCTSPPEPGYGIVWLVNGTSAASSQLFYTALGEEVQSGDGGVQRNITFTADIRANNTHLRCIISSFRGDFHISVDLSLILQGRVPPPTVTYEMSMDHHSIIFLWSGPFTLNISDIEPDILHYVVNIISEDGYTGSVTTTDTHYELQADPCQSHQYHVEIAAVNVVGEGEKYKSPEMNFEGYAVASVSDTTVFFNGRLVLIQITLEASPHCHEMNFVVKYTVELNATYSQDRLLFNSSGNARQHTLSLNSNDNSLKRNELYAGFIRIEELPNSESTRIELSTFDIQDVRTIHDQHSGHIDITCYFAKGSDAKGCRIIAQTQNDTTPCQFVATREDRDESIVTVALQSGMYTLLVYDDEEEEDNNPAFTIHSVHSSAQVSECATLQIYNNVQSASTNYLIVSLAAAGGLLLPVITIIICLTVSVVLFRREKRKAAIAMTPNTAYEEVKVKQKKRRTTPSHGQPVLTPNHELAVSTRMDTNVAYGVVP